MTGKTHLLAGLVIGVMMAEPLGFPNSQAIFVIGAAALGSLLPDLDSPKSIITNLFPPVRLLFFWTTHRGILHTAIIPSILAIAAYLLPQYMVLWALCAGYLSHISLDAMTKGGVPFLWPVWKGNFHLLPPFFRITTGGISESLFVLLCILGTLWLAWPQIAHFL